MAQITIHKKQAKIIVSSIFIVAILLTFQSGRNYLIWAEDIAQETEIAERNLTIVIENRESGSGFYAGGSSDFQSKLPKDMSSPSTSIGNGDQDTDDGGSRSTEEQSEQPTEEAIERECSRLPTPAEIQSCTTDCVITNGLVGAACTIASKIPVVNAIPGVSPSLAICENSTRIVSTQCGNMCDNAITVDCKTGEPFLYDGSQGNPGEFPYITDPAGPLFGQQ